MIHLASDPNASRQGWRPTANDGKDAPQRRRSGHAWPFLSREASRPAAPDAPKDKRSDSGS